MDIEDGPQLGLIPSAIFNLSANSIAHCTTATLCKSESQVQPKVEELFALSAAAEVVSMIFFFRDNIAVMLSVTFY